MRTGRIDYSRELMMRELEEREQRLRTNKMAKPQEMDEKESQHVNSAAGCSHDDTDDHARQEKEREAREKREETRRLTERIVQATATAARKETENSEVQDRTLADQDTMAADEPHEFNRVATWQHLVVPRGLATVPERERYRIDNRD